MIVGSLRQRLMSGEGDKERTLRASARAQKRASAEEVEKQESEMEEAFGADDEFAPLSDQNSDMILMKTMRPMYRKNKWTTE